MSKAIVVKEGLLTGKIGSEGTLSGSVVSEGALSGSLIMSIDYEDHPGPYKVTSEGTLTGKIGSEGTLSGSIVKVESQSLSTADKRMVHDVTIEPIPYYEVSNQNGKTIIIDQTKKYELIQ